MLFPWAGADDSGFGDSGRILDPREHSGGDRDHTVGEFLYWVKARKYGKQDRTKCKTRKPIRFSFDSNDSHPETRRISVFRPVPVLSSINAT